MPSCFYLHTPKAEFNPCCLSPQTPPSLSGKQTQPCQWKITSLPAKPDQLGSAGYSSRQVAQGAGELQGVPVPGRAPKRTQTRKRWSKASKLLTFHAVISRQWASPGGSQVSKKRCNFQKAKKKKKKRQQCPDTDSGCSIKPSWTDRVQQLTSVFSRKQNKQETYLGGIAVDSCGVSKYADKKQKWCNRNRRRHRNPSLQLRGCTAEELRLRPLQTALTESWNNSPDRNKIGENNHDHRTELIPSKSLHYRQDTHLVTSITIAHRVPRQLVSSSSHFSAPSHAALNINSADNCLETVSAETGCTEQLKDIGPSSKTTGGHDKRRKGDRTKVSATVILWLQNFSLQISTFPDPDFTDASAY